MPMIYVHSPDGSSRQRRGRLEGTCSRK